MADIKTRIGMLMRRVREQGELPGSAAIVKETFERLGYVEGAISAEEVIKRFNELLRTLWMETLVTLETHEDRVYAAGIPRELIKEFPDQFSASEHVARSQGFQEGVTHLISQWYPYLRRVFLSVSQSRMQRGGKDFELQIEGLFALAGIPYQEQEKQNRTDLILPNLEAYTRNRNVAAIVSVKRTLRERWAEVAEELFNLRSPNVFLFTADENVSTNHIERICGRYNIYLVVWDSEKAAKFSDQPLVIGYTEWAVQLLAAMKQHW